MGLDEALRAIAQPHRRAILRLVANDELAAGEIAAVFDVTRTAVSQHLTVLRNAGLISERRVGTRRLYRARPEGLAELREFLHPRPVRFDSGGVVMNEAVRYLMFYQTAEGFQAGARREHFPAHQARYQEFMRRGVLLAVGPFTDGDGGAMGVFTSREAAEEFARVDPFVVNGVVSKWHVREWRQVTPE